MANSFSDCRKLRMIPPILLPQGRLLSRCVGFLVLSCVKEEIDPDLHKEKLIQKDCCNKEGSKKYGEFSNFETLTGSAEKEPFFFFFFLMLLFSH